MLKMINNYFKNCCRFDVIYQNKIGDIDLKSSIQDKETSNNNRTCLTASSLKKILNANKEKKETLKSSSMIKDKTMNSFHSNDINYKECRSDSIRLHKECSDKKEKINRKVQRLKQQLLSDDHLNCLLYLLYSPQNIFLYYTLCYHKFLYYPSFLSLFPSQLLLHLFYTHFCTTYYYYSSFSLDHTPLTHFRINPL